MAGSARRRPVRRRGAAAADSRRSMSRVPGRAGGAKGGGEWRIWRRWKREVRRVSAPLAPAADRGCIPRRADYSTRRPARRTDASCRLAKPLRGRGRAESHSPEFRRGSRNVLRDLQESPLGRRANQLESMTIEMVAMMFVSSSKPAIFQTDQAQLGRLQFRCSKRRCSTARSSRRRRTRHGF